VFEEWGGPLKRVEEKEVGRVVCRKGTDALLRTGKGVVCEKQGEKKAQGPPEKNRKSSNKPNFRHCARKAREHLQSLRRGTRKKAKKWRAKAR